LAAELQSRFPNATIQLIPSRGGRFEVVANGVPVFEKSRVGRHADPGEVVRGIVELGAAS
jgi:selT/selW/selH-like putative selenoprotein